MHRPLTPQSEPNWRANEREDAEEPSHPLRHSAALAVAHVHDADSHAEGEYLDELALHTVRHSHEQTDAMRGSDWIVLVPVVEQHRGRPALSQPDKHQRAERQAQSPGKQPPAPRPPDLDDDDRDPRQEQIELPPHVERPEQDVASM